VTHILIFGSSTGTWHFYEKDIDVCLIGQDPEPEDERSYYYQKQMKLPKVRYDFLVYDTLDDLNPYEHDVSSIRYYILKEGVMIYEKS
jgi:predicted nucleotidyltransferase